MNIQGPDETNSAGRQPVPMIAVFYPGNSLMHQVSNWAIRHPDYDFAFSFAESLKEIRGVLRRSAISIADATDDPGLAMTAFVQALSMLEVSRVAVYTETMHEGLELFVRIRGAPLLLGPLNDAPWEEQLEKMLQSARRVYPLGCFAQWSTQSDAATPKGWTLKCRLRPFPAKAPRRSSYDRR